MDSTERVPALTRHWQDVRQAVDRACLEAGRAPASVAILPVSKTFGPAHVSAGQALGWTRFGENRVQEIRDKQAQLTTTAPQWVLIGHLQSNKARQAVSLISELQSLDRLDLARRLDGYLQQAGRSLDVLLQIHTAAEAHKHGLPPAALGAMLAGLQSLPTLRLQGLMTVATQTTDPVEIRRCFALARQLREQAEQCLGRALPRLSMGMSGDFVQAIAEGSTELRIGSALFGTRG